MKRYDGLLSIELAVNGERYQASVTPGDTLLHSLRSTLGLTGTKLGCENGDCGACTVLLEGKPVKSCYTLTLAAEGREITTIEGLRETPVQQAFAAAYGFQCGYCTPGFVLNTHALLQRHPKPDEATTREWLESNLCRCTGYETIAEAVQLASESEPQ